MIESMIKKYDSHLKKIAMVFSYKSRGTIDKEDFYQEFAIRLIELVRRYQDKPDPDFRKILNFSLHNLGCDLLKQQFRYVVVDHTDAANGHLFKTVVEPHFLYFYKEAMLSTLQSAKSKEIFEWLLDNMDSVEKLRQEKNLAQQRERRLVLGDAMDCIVSVFGIARCKAEYHMSKIKEAMRAIHAEELAC